jgi:hypothetical protein
MTLLTLEGKDLGTLIHREQRGTKSIQFPILSYNNWYRPFINRHHRRLLGHVLEGLFQMLLAEGKLADGPDLGVLVRRVSILHQRIMAVS